MNELKIGDTVELINLEIDPNERLKIGDTGKVVKTSPYSKIIGVDWGRDICGHNLDGLARHTRGWCVPMSCLKLVKSKRLSKKEKEKTEKKRKLIIKEIKSKKEYKTCFENVSKEVNSWNQEVILNYKLD